MGTSPTSPGKLNYRGLDLEKTSRFRSRQKFFLDIPFYRTHLPLRELPTFRNRTAIVNIGVSALKGFIRDHVGHEHSSLEVDGIGAWRNADGLEFASHAVITDTARFAFAGNEMQRPASVANNPKAHWHPLIMLRRVEHVQRITMNPRSKPWGL